MTKTGNKRTDYLLAHINSAIFNETIQAIIGDVASRSPEQGASIDLIAEAVNRAIGATASMVANIEPRRKAIDLIERIAALDTEYVGKYHKRFSLMSHTELLDLLESLKGDLERLRDDMEAEIEHWRS